MEKMCLRKYKYCVMIETDKDNKSHEDIEYVKTLWFIRGIQGSGKSTIARKICKKFGAMRINRDDLRAMASSDYSYEKDRCLFNCQLEIADKMFKCVDNVVIDNTHIKEKDVAAWKEYCRAREFNFREVVLRTPLWKCIIRNLLRKNRVPTRVVIDTYRLAKKNGLYDVVVRGR